MTDSGDGAGFRVIRREDLSAAAFLLEIAAPDIARAAQPGQFVIVMSTGSGERIPLTIADYDRERGTITLVIQPAGKTTKQMQRDVRAGSELYAVAGPMGNPSVIDGIRKVVCVGGGLGVAPVYPQARAFKEHGAYVIGVIGFRTKDLAFWLDRFGAVCDELILCSDDGSIGMKGLVTEGLAQAIARHGDVDEVVAIGPPVMMRACAALTRPRWIHTVVSLNPIMVDGTGMCGGCRVRVGDETRFACVDGPEFDAHEVDFEDLISRLRRYTAEERAALERWEREVAAPTA